MISSFEFFKWSERPKFKENIYPRGRRRRRRRRREKEEKEELEEGELYIV